MSVQSKWQVWQDDERMDPALKSELSDLVAGHREEELQDRFFQELEFGTGGLRAKLGVGTNRLNVHTIRRASAAVVKWLMAKSPDQKKIAIGYDGRHKSREFAEAVAQVAAAHQVHAVLYRHPRPTPFLSYAVRRLSCGAGVMITASHNPPEYNGFKVYRADGGQILTDDAETIVRLIEEAKDIFSVPYLSNTDDSYKEWVQDTDLSLEEEYYQEIAVLSGLASQELKSNLRIVYTPLHGTGAVVVPEALSRAGFDQVTTVDAQMELDPDFRHTKSPNPEEHSAYDLAIQVAKNVQADVILATDPDADRVGLVARAKDGSYQFLSGNDTGALALDYYLKTLSDKGQLPLDARVVTTIVTSGFGEAVATAYGVSTERTLTGFKYIGDKIGTYETHGDQQFVFGYEESVGYLVLPFVRDKDAVQAAVLLASMAAKSKLAYGSVPDALDALFSKHGYYLDKLLGYTFAGMTGPSQMKVFMDDLRSAPVMNPEVPLVVVEDYLSMQRLDVTTGHTTPLTLPESDVMKFIYAGGSWIAVRPSGTEPKLKVYIGAHGAKKDEAERALKALDQAFTDRINPFLQR